MQLILGDHDVRVFEGTEQLLKTENIIWHPKQVLFFHAISQMLITTCYYYVILHMSLITVKNTRVEQIQSMSKIVHYPVLSPAMTTRLWTMTLC